MPWHRAFAATLFAILVLLLITGSIRFELQSQHTQQSVIDGATCILGNIQGREDIERPDPELVEKACERYLRDMEE